MQTQNDWFQLIQDVVNTLTWVENCKANVTESEKELHRVVKFTNRLIQEELHEMQTLRSSNRDTIGDDHTA